MKCRNIFCNEHSLRYKENCGVIIPARIGQDRISYATECKRRKSYNQVNRAKLYRLYFLTVWKNEHDKYYGRK